MTKRYTAVVTSQPGPDVGMLRPIDLGRSLAENAADRIREQVLIGGYSQGQHLVEAKIADELQISRGPVREAFKMLRAEGLLTEEPRRGTFVVSITSQDVRDIYGLRAAIEGAAAADCCAAARTPTTIAKLDEAVDAIGAAARHRRRRSRSRRPTWPSTRRCACCPGNLRLLETFRRYVPVLRGLLRHGRADHALHRRRRRPAPARGRGDPRRRRGRGRAPGHRALRAGGRAARRPARAR